MIASTTRSHCARRSRSSSVLPISISARAVGGHERGGLRLLRALDAAARHGVPIGSGPGHVEEDHGHARGRGERRDPASHRSRPDHTQPANAHDLVLRRNCHVLEQYEGVKIRDDVARATVLNVLLDERLRRCHVSLAATTRADPLGLPNRRASSPLSDRAAWSGRYRISYPSTLYDIACPSRAHARKLAVSPRRSASSRCWSCSSSPASRWRSRCPSSPACATECPCVPRSNSSAVTSPRPAPRRFASRSWDTSTRTATRSGRTSISRTARASTSRRACR